MRSVVATLALGLLVPSTVEGYAKYVKLIPNGGDVPDNTNIGHLDAAGETGLSLFGKAFSTAGNAWGAALCQQDTDGDGFTNGQELGDPCCTWTESNTGSLVTDGVSDPNDATKTPTSAELKAGCSSGASTSTNSTGSGGMSDVVGTVSPAGPSTGTGGMPPDDDWDDDDESAVLTAGASMTTISSVAVGVAMAVAAAIAL
ncbi:hypothetical protein PHMEG_000150 [Phytophthora megakarya]|uniref:Temptin Cys/Cys disulfide domain-containing protein n=1 Tax=Phytophthora megakarya TaxID=4795 RepID=A0A225X444_9STRA|nr:hypothetical protein PHMEG_000150 [Phytophthora megakarya]